MAEQPPFKIFTGLLKASRSTDGRMRLHGVASSTTRDLHGDIMTPTAIDDMVTAAGNNMTIFLNHSYNVPEDVAGSVERASSKVRSVDHEGNPNVDLDLDIVINETNPRAVKTFEAIERGTKLGLSIGAFIPDGGATRQKSGAYVIEHVDLKETSIVSIPANPRSWVEYAMKSLHTNPITNYVALGSDTSTNVAWFTAADACPECGGSRDNPRNGCKNSFHGDAAKTVEPELTAESHSELPDSAFACIDKDGRHYPHHTSSGAVDKGLLRSALSRCGDASNTHCGCAHIRAHARSLGIGDSEKSFDELLVEAVTDDFDELHFHLGEDLDVTDATVTVETPFANVTVDTGNRGRATEDGDSSQAAAPSEPEAEDGGLVDETADGDDERLGDTVTRSVEPDVQLGGLTEALDLVRDMTRKLVAAQAEAAELRTQLSAIETEKQAAFTQRDTVLRETKAILDRVADAPLMRKTVVVSANNDFRAKFGGIYSDDILRLLERTND